MKILPSRYTPSVNSNSSVNWKLLGTDLAKAAAVAAVITLVIVCLTNPPAALALLLLKAKAIDCIAFFLTVLFTVVLPLALIRDERPLQAKDVVKSLLALIIFSVVLFFPPTFIGAGFLYGAALFVTPFALAYSSRNDEQTKKNIPLKQLP